MQWKKLLIFESLVTLMICERWRDNNGIYIILIQIMFLMIFSERS